MSQSKTQGQSKSKSQSKANAALRAARKRSAERSEAFARVAAKFTRTVYDLSGDGIVDVREPLTLGKSYAVTLTGAELAALYLLLGDVAKAHRLGDAKRRELAKSVPWQFGATNLRAYLGEAIREREDAADDVDTERRREVARRARA